MVRMAFEAYASGDYSISAITELLDASGLRLPMTAKRPSRPMRRSAVYRMLQDDYYTGVVTYCGSKNDGQHPGLIDAETFEQVQALLKAHALSRLDALKQEQQHLLQLSYRDLVDTEVLADEQQRIKQERARLAKWAKSIAHNEQEIQTALEEALHLLDAPGDTSLRAKPTIRRD
jgi:Recombinase